MVVDALIRARRSGNTWRTIQDGYEGEVASGDNHHRHGEHDEHDGEHGEHHDDDDDDDNGDKYDDGDGEYAKHNNDGKRGPGQRGPRWAATQEWGFPGGSPAGVMASMKWPHRMQQRGFEGGFHRGFGGWESPEQCDDGGFAFGVEDLCS